MWFIGCGSSLYIEVPLIPRHSALKFREKNPIYLGILTKINIFWGKISDGGAVSNSKSTHSESSEEIFFKNVDFLANFFFTIFPILEH